MRTGLHRLRRRLPLRGHGRAADEVHPNQPGLRRQLPATGNALSRHTGYDANQTRAFLEACAAACKACGDECEGHADMHEKHCRICAEDCRRWEAACRDLITSFD